MCSSVAVRGLRVQGHPREKAPPHSQGTSLTTVSVRTVPHMHVRMFGDQHPATRNALGEHPYQYARCLVACGGAPPHYICHWDAQTDGLWSPSFCLAPRTPYICHWDAQQYIKQELMAYPSSFDEHGMNTTRAGNDMGKVTRMGCGVRHSVWRPERLQHCEPLAGQRSLGQRQRPQPFHQPCGYRWYGFNSSCLIGPQLLSLSTSALSFRLRHSGLDARFAQ